MGDDLDPAVITQLLGCEPSRAQVNGEQLPTSQGGFRTARGGMWRLQTADRTPEDLNSQIGELLSKLSDDLQVWASLRERYRIDLFCGIFLKGGNEGLSISPESSAALGARGIELGLDIYGQLEEGESRAV
jgi:hypothetical protein